MHQRLCQDYAQLQTVYNKTFTEKNTFEADLLSANLQGAALAAQLETSNFLQQVRFLDVHVAEHETMLAISHISSIADNTRGCIGAELARDCCWTCWCRN